MVHGITETPNGAHFTSCVPDYGRDETFQPRRGAAVCVVACAEGWLPYAKVFTMVAAGRRHVMMGAAQIDRYGNQNISCIGDWARPRTQLLGVRGAPGNTVNHPVSYLVPRHSRRVSR